MLVDINRIVVGDRIRRDFGDIQELADDIAANGLINPPTINKEYRLLAGERRLRACKLLGWTQIEVHMLDTQDEAHDLAVEMSENNMRRNFTGSELAAGIRRQMELESAKARERMQDPMQTFAEGQKGTARDKAAEHFGISGEQARKTVFVDEHRDLLDPADFADWDEGRLSTNKAYQRVKAAQARAEQERDLALQDLESAQKEITALERQNDALHNLTQQQQVVEREVIVEVAPDDYEDAKRHARDLERGNRMYSDENAKLRRQLEDTRRELDRAKGILGMSQQTQEVRRDVQYLIAATNQYVRQYGGLTWTAASLASVDEPTLEELRKAVTNLATFSSALVASLEELR